MRPMHDPDSLAQFIEHVRNARRDVDVAVETLTALFDDARWLENGERGWRNAMANLMWAQVELDHLEFTGHARWNEARGEAETK